MRRSGPGRCWPCSGLWSALRVRPVQLLLSVSKRRFRHAVSRNRAKRLMREAYRRHKHLLLWAATRGPGA